MHLPTVTLSLLLYLLTPITLAAPSRTGDPVFTISKFAAYIADASTAISWASFHFSDPDSSHSLEIDCLIGGHGTEIYELGHHFEPCSGNSDVGFRLSEGELRVMRKWQSDTMFITGEAPQGTYWQEDVNVTRVEGGKQYTRATDWEFPVTTMRAIGGIRPSNIKTSPLD